LTYKAYIDKIFREVNNDKLGGKTRRFKYSKVLIKNLTINDCLHFEELKKFYPEDVLLKIHNDQTFSYDVTTPIKRKKKYFHTMKPVLTPIITTDVKTLEANFFKYTCKNFLIEQGVVELDFAELASVAIYEIQIANSKLRSMRNNILYKTDTPSELDIQDRKLKDEQAKFKKFYTIEPMIFSFLKTYKIDIYSLPAVTKIYEDTKSTMVFRYMRFLKQKEEKKKPVANKKRGEERKKKRKD